MNESLIRIAILLALFVGFALPESDRIVSAEVLTAKTWDGGGTTNNWSDAANWSADTVPVAGDDVTFDATSTKNVTIDTNINIGSIVLAAGYTGTITQSNAASILIGGCSGRPCFRQDGGTFVGSSNTMTLNNIGFGALTLNGGTFTGGSGDITFSGVNGDLNLQGGTFTSTSGNLTCSGTLRFQGTSVFNHNNGKITINSTLQPAMAVDSNHTSVTFNNLTFDLPNGVNFFNGGRMIVLGALALNDGSIGSNGSTIEARGNVTLSPNFDGGNFTLEFGPAGTPRTLTLAAGPSWPKILLNDPNVTVNTSGSGTLVLPHQLVINQGTFNQGNVDLSVSAEAVGGGSCLVVSGGTFNGSNKTLTLTSNGFGAVSMTGGAFNGGSGDITATGDVANTNHDFQVNGGIFKSTSGTLFVARSFRFQNGGAFQHNGGTVVFNSGTTASIVTDDGAGHHPALTFNNLTVNRDSGTMLQLFTDGIIVNGTLSMNDGIIDDAGGSRTIDARGNVNVATTFDGLTFRNILLFTGTSCQTITLNGTPNFPGVWTTNKTGCGITAVGNFGVQSMQVPSGNFIFGNGDHANLAGDLTIGPNGRVTVSQQTVINVGGSTTSSGTLDISGSGNAVNLNSLSIDPTGQFISGQPGTITLAGDVVNNGLVNLHGFGSDCLIGSGTSVTLQSSVAGTRRSWSGNGVFRMVHVNALDMGGTATIRAHNSTSSGGNNGANWIFDSACQANVLHTPFDFDGDSKTDVAMFRPGAQEWWLRRSTLGSVATQFGIATDKITPADFDGDGLTDVAVWRQSSQANFYILESSTGTLRTENFGIPGDDPKIVADWDGDGKADPAVFRQGAGGSTFFFRGSRNNPNGNITFLPWGIAADKPVRGDFDGDGKADAAVFKSDGTWWIRRSSNGALVVQFWGLVNDRPIDGDFDGDGKSDVAVFRPSDTNWYIIQSSNGQPRVQPFGLATDVLTPGDYDGDGKTDLAIFRPSNNQTWILFSGSGTATNLIFGASGDIPVASAYVP